MELDVASFALSLAEPLRTSNGTINTRRGWLVRVRQDGTVGIGEATPLPGWTESKDACRRALQQVSGAHDAEPIALLEQLQETPAARHGVALAALDRRSRAAASPLRLELLDTGGGEHTSEATPESVPVNATIGDVDPERTATLARRAVDAGFECLKLKVGARSLDGDRQRLRAVREAVGEEVVIRADANGAWDRTEAAAAIAALDDADVDLVEQPLPADDLAGLRELRGNGVAIAADESLRGTAVKRIVEADAADAIVCKPMVLGGPDRAVRTATTARQHGLDVIVTTTVDAVVARTAAVHVAGALAPIDHCGLATADRLAKDLAPDPAPVEDGAISVPTAVGTGVDAAVLSEYFE